MPRSAGGAKPGDWNLRGKKRVLCAYRCCDVVDFREDYESHRVGNEELTLGLESVRDEGEPQIWGGLVDVRERDDADRGRWKIFTQKKGEVGIISSDFKHDVVLYVNGDFADDESKLEYAQLIAARLNRTIPQ